MINGVNNVGAGAINNVATTRVTSPAPVPGKNFTEILNARLEEISRLQQNIPAPMTKTETAFQNLLAIQGKLLESYKEICAIGI